MDVFRADCLALDSQLGRTTSLSGFLLSSVNLCSIGHRPHGLFLICFGMPIEVILVQFLFSLWLDSHVDELMGAASDVIR